MLEATTNTGGESKFQRPSPEASDDAIRAVLSQDHDRLERQFESIVAEASSGDPIALRKAWQEFESELIHHFDDEEAHVLPAFAQQRPTEASALLYEHQRIRSDLTTLGVDLDLHCLPTERVADFVASLRAHARREDDLLYPWAAHRLGEAARKRAERTMLNTDKRAMTKSETWHIDLDQSSLRFSLRHVVIHEIRGRFEKWGGSVALDGDDLTKASVSVWIDLGSVDTDETERDDQIRSPEFFDVASFSTGDVHEHQGESARARRSTRQGSPRPARGHG
jgi:hemerythrin superfamily protein